MSLFCCFCCDTLVKWLKRNTRNTNQGAAFYAWKWRSHPIYMDVQELLCVPIKTKKRIRFCSSTTPYLANWFQLFWSFSILLFINVTERFFNTPRHVQPLSILQFSHLRSARHRTVMWCIAYITHINSKCVNKQSCDATIIEHTTEQGDMLFSFIPIILFSTILLPGELMEQHLNGALSRPNE